MKVLQYGGTERWAWEIGRKHTAQWLRTKANTMLVHLPFHKGVNSRGTQLQQVLDVFDPDMNLTRGRILGTCHLGEENNCHASYPAITSKMTGFLHRTWGNSNMTFLRTHSLTSSVPFCLVVIALLPALSPLQLQRAPDNVLVLLWNRKGEGTVGQTQSCATAQWEGLCVAHSAQNTWGAWICWALPSPPSTFLINPYVKIRCRLQPTHFT